MARMRTFLPFAAAAVYSGSRVDNAQKATFAQFLKCDGSTTGDLIISDFGLDHHKSSEAVDQMLPNFPSCCLQ